MTQRSADVVVIGGGVIGTSIAMHLGRMGAGRVLLVEKGHLASGASGRSGAMVREHYLHPVLVKMAMEASDIFHNFGDAVGGDARFTQTGRLLLFGENDEAAVRANVEMNRELGVEINTLTPSEILQVVPQVSLEGVNNGVVRAELGSRGPDGHDVRVRGAGEKPRSGDSDRVRGYGDQGRGRSRGRSGNG